MAYRWPADTSFRELTREVEERTCWPCQPLRTVGCHRPRRCCTGDGPGPFVGPLCPCANPTCPGQRATVRPATALVLPYGVLGWNLFSWLGHRRCARHGSVPPRRAELRDRWAMPLSVDARERYVGRDQRLRAARQRDPAAVARA